MSTFNNFITTVSFSDFSAENWDALVKDGISAEHMPWDETEIQILWNMHQSTTLTLKNHVDQILNRAINHYNGVLTTTYNKIATLETEVTYLCRGSLEETLPQKPRCQSHQHLQALKIRYIYMIGWARLLYIV